MQRFDFQSLFIDELGWSQPTSRQAVTFPHDGVSYERRQIAQLSGVVVFEIHSADGRMPDAKARAAIHKDVSRHHHENLLIFLDQNRTQSLWYWVKREGTKTFPREHLYVTGQSGDLFLSKLGAMVVDISELDETGSLPVTEVATRLKKALDIERVTKKFYREFQDQHIAFIDLIQGIDDDRQRRWYASVLLNRLMFIYFLQKKGFLDNGNQNYLHDKLAQSKATSGEDSFFAVFLKALFFEGFAKPEHERSAEARKLLGSIKYLNGGLFLPHSVEQANPDIRILDAAFENLLGLFQSYSWNLNDTPGGKDDEINPDVLGYIFEKYINQKAFGAYYTRPEITEYLCEHTIYKLILNKVNTPGIPGILAPRRFDSIADLLLNLDADLCRELLFTILPDLGLLDPACGSGAFLVAAMKTLINLYSAIIGKIKFLNDRKLTEWLHKKEIEHKSIAYFIKKSIITDNLFGVDIMEEATEIAKLRLFLALVAAAQHVDELEPLPNIDFNILAGNSLIGLLHVADADYERDAQGDLFRKTYRELLSEKNRLIESYRHFSGYTDDLRSQRDTIKQKKHEAIGTLNKILLEEFSELGIKFEEATWDTAKNKEGKPKKRALTLKDIEALHPFHWGYEFDDILNKRGGFDAIITNPPWDVLEPSAKEFFEEYSEVVTKNIMSLQEFEKERTKILSNEIVKKAWLEYLSSYHHISRYFKLAPQYANQISVISGRTAASKTNLYKLFVEQVFRLLKDGGECGMVIPDGIYNGRGATQLRRLLLEQTAITGLFCLENRKDIFEGVDSRFKIAVMTFEKGKPTTEFPAAFMRTDVAELDHFPSEGAITLSAKLICEFSPEMLAVTEFKGERDVQIVRKFLVHPRLDETIPEAWNVVLAQELNMTSDNGVFKKEHKAGCLPLVQGGMIHQFNADFSEPKFWIDEKDGRGAILGRVSDDGQKLPYQFYRFAHRRIARSTDERAAISCVLPPQRFCADTAQTTREIISPKHLLFLTAVFNSYIVDWELRLRITTHVDMHFVYAMRIPRLTEKDPAFRPIVERAARLICTTPEFDDLAKEAGIGSNKQGVTNEYERGCLRAELDGLIAHLYGLTEVEFAYILTTFPLVADPVKIAAQNAYRDVERGLIK